MRKALIIIDLQNDFMAGGSLAVPEGEKIIPEVNRLQDDFDLIIATQDWHPANHGSFASQHPGKKPFETGDLNGLEQVFWPDHCIQGSHGALFHPDLRTEKINAIIRKGMDAGIDSYSGFYDNGRRKKTGLTGFLKGLDVDHLFFCGLAADYCVYYSIKDAIEEGFRCSLFLPATRALSHENFEEIKKELSEKKVELINY